jgi:hypothetical protein
MSTAADRVFYTVYRFFERMHGPGASAEIAVLFLWCMMLVLNVVSALLIGAQLLGALDWLRTQLTPIFLIGGVVVTVTEYFRYIGGDRLRELKRTVEAESRSDRIRRRFLTVTYPVATVVIFGTTLWILAPD